MDFGFWILDFGFRILDFGFWILDFGFWILDFGFRILDFGFWILDFGFRISDFGFWISDFGLGAFSGTFFGCYIIELVLCTPTRVGGFGFSLAVINDSWLISIVVQCICVNFY